MFKDSRYNRERSFPLSFRGTTRRALTFRTIDRTVPPGAVLHTVTAADTLDILAYRYLGSGEYWWLIADLNPQIEPWSLESAIGEQIWIPPKHDALNRIQVYNRLILEVSEEEPSAYVISTT